MYGEKYPNLALTTLLPFYKHWVQIYANQSALRQWTNCWCLFRWWQNGRSLIPKKCPLFCKAHFARITKTDQSNTSWSQRTEDWMVTVRQSLWSIMSVMRVYIRIFCIVSQSCI